MSLGNAIAWQFVCATGYAAAILALGGESADLLGILVNEWVLLANRFVRTVTFFLPEPPHTFGVLGLLDLYQHILVFSLLIASVWLWMLRPCWDSWANDLYPAATGNARALPLHQNMLRYSYRMMVLGRARGNISVVIPRRRIGCGEVVACHGKMDLSPCPVARDSLFCICLPCHRDPSPSRRCPPCFLNGGSHPRPACGYPENCRSGGVAGPASVEVWGFSCGLSTFRV